MYKRVHYFGSVVFVCSLIYLVRVVFTQIFEDETALVDEWLDQNELAEYKKLFREYGISTLSGCGSPDQLDRLPELPAAEEKRLRRAAQVLQQRLVLRQWLATHKLQHAYTKLLSLDVSSLEDVYWLEDTTARHVLDPKDFGAWSAARQSLPTGKEALQTLKSDLWSAVVKNSKHQDAWTWGRDDLCKFSYLAYNAFAFMSDRNEAATTRNTVENIETNTNDETPSATQFNQQQQQDDSNISRQRSKRKPAKEPDDLSYGTISEAFRILQQCAEAQQAAQPPCDSYSAFGQYIANELKKYDPVTLAHVKKDMRNNI